MFWISEKTPSIKKWHNLVKELIPMEFLTCILHSSIDRCIQSDMDSLFGSCFSHIGRLLAFYLKAVVLAQNEKPIPVNVYVSSPVTYVFNIILLRIDFRIVELRSA